MATIPEEETRAAAFRQSLRNRAAAQAANLTALSGSKAERDTYVDAYQPLLDARAERDLPGGSDGS